MRLVLLAAGAGLVLRGSSALRAGVLSSCFAKKKVAKEEGDPRLRGRLRRLPCATRHWRALRNSGLRPSDSPRAFSASTCVARRSTWGPGKASTPNQRNSLLAVLLCLAAAKGSSWAEPSFRDAFRVPMRGAEQRRSAGRSRLALSEPKASLASRPAFRVAQGTPLSGAPTLGAPSFWLLFLGEARKSTPARKAENSSQISDNLHQSDKPGKVKQVGTKQLLEMYQARAGAFFYNGRLLHCLQEHHSWQQ